MPKLKAVMGIPGSTYQGEHARRLLRQALDLFGIGASQAAVARLDGAPELEIREVNEALHRIVALGKAFEAIRIVGVTP